MDTGTSFPCDSLSPAEILLVGQQFHISARAREKKRNLHSDRMTKNQTKILTLLSSGMAP
jgi:hypothetical protein